MGFLAPVLGAVGDAASTAASAVGSGLASAGSAAEGALGDLATTSGLGNLGSGIAQLFGGSAPSEAAKIAGLGQAVPEGVDLVGPSSTFTGPGFMGGFMQGFTGTAKQLANPSAATQVGTGLGQLFDALNNARGTASMPVVNLPPSTQMGGPATKVTPPAPVVNAQQGPIMKLIGQLFAGF